MKGLFMKKQATQTDAAEVIKESHKEEVKAPERTLEVVNQEYLNQCAVAGQLQHFIIINKEQLEEANANLRKLNREALALQVKA
jgi:hypothetical protein